MRPILGTYSRYASCTTTYSAGTSAGVARRTVTAGCWSGIYPGRPLSACRSQADAPVQRARVAGIQDPGEVGAEIALQRRRPGHPVVVQPGQPYVLGVIEGVGPYRVDRLVLRGAGLRVAPVRERVVGAGGVEQQRAARHVRDQPVGHDGE